MRVLIVTPAPRGSRAGNRVTALRWAAHLRALGHAPRLREDLDGAPADLLVALHAEKSAAALERWRTERGDAPAVLVLTGTDLYDRDEPSALTRASCARADRLVVLQPGALERVPVAARARTRCIPQSARAPDDVPAPDPERFTALSLAHLRPVKDPLLLARAARRAPERSRLAAVLAGEALDDDLAGAVQAEQRANPRFRWIGPLSRRDALRRLAAADVLVVTSRNEGGPAVIPEAVACDTPVLSTDMPAARALLGADHPGLYPVGDDAALAELLRRAEEDDAWRAELSAAGRRLAPEVAPERERDRVAALLAELAP